MGEPFRLAFIGVDHPHGAGWRELLPHFANEILLTAIVPAFGGGIVSLEERYAEVPRFENCDALLKFGQFDGAIVCLPNDETPAVVIALANAGKAILLEKPGSDSAEHFAPVAAAIEKNRVAFQNGFMWKYDAGAERLAAMIQEGRFGKLISLECRLVTSDVQRRGPTHYLFDKKRSGHGFFNWLGCHYLDLIPYLTGATIVAVTARIGCFGGIPLDVEDGGTAILELSNGALATFIGGYWIPRWSGEAGWTVRGTQRWVQWEPTKPGTGGEFRIHGPQPQFHAMEETFTLPVDTVTGYGGRMAVKLIRDWLDEARTGRSGSRNSVSTTRKTLQVLDAIYVSSEEGRRVQIRD